MGDSYALLFPGQGAQFAGMGASFAEASPSARRRLEQAGDTLGFDIGKLVLEGPESDLALTSNTQPAILLVSVMALDALAERMGLSPAAVAGHSLGEFSACYAAGVFGFEDALRITRKRGELMQSATPPGVGGMAAILGLPADDVTAVCREAGGEVWPANFNSPEQTVIAGKKADVERAGELAAKKGAKKVVPLAVSAPFHTPLMKPAQEGLAEFMNNITFADPKFPVIRNVDAGLSRTAAEVRDGLVRQVTGCVRWVDSMRQLPDLGVTQVYEVGPGKTLCGLMKRIEKGITASSVGTAAEAVQTVEAAHG